MKQKRRLKRKRILIVNVNWRGDVLFSTPFIRAVRKKYADSFIASMVPARCAPILEQNPHLDEVIILDEERKHKGLFGKLRLIRLLRLKQFDTAFLLHRSLTKTLICLLAAIPQRIGYHTKKRFFFLTKSIAQPQNKEQLHRVEYFLNIARACGIKAGDSNYEYFLSQQDRSSIKRLLEENGIKEEDFLVVVNPGGNWHLKRWPKENFAQLGDRLIREYRVKLAITGAKKDIALAEEISALMQEAPFIFCGKTTLSELAALMAKANLVISNDSGPMHIAVSRGTSVIALFGPTSARITGPYGKGNYKVIQKDVDCKIPCYNPSCIDNRCMKAIVVEDVLEAVRSKLAHYSKRLT